MTHFRFGILIVLLAFTGAAAADGVGTLKAFYDRVDTLRADFHQTQVDERGEVVQQAGGIFLLQRPQRFRWEYDTPYKQIIVSDGKAFRFYDVDLAQVTVREVGRTLQSTPAALLTGGTALGDEFEINSNGRRDGLDWVQLVPHARDSDFKRIRMGLDNGVPKRMELDDQLGQTTRIVFSGVRVNGRIDPSRFTLELPDDVDVVDARSGAGK